MNLINCDIRVEKHINMGYNGDIAHLPGSIAARHTYNNNLE